MAIKITLRGRDGDISAIVQRDVKELIGRLTRAVQGASEDVADEIKNRGDRDITAAGNFGSRWTDSLEVVAHLEGLKSKVTVRHTIPYAHIFETGGTIQGKPLLWIPLSGTDAVGLRARDYPGGLFRVTRKSDGLPLLGSRVSGEIKYVGKSSVKIPKKFHLIEICTDAASHIVSYLSRRLNLK